MKTLGQRLSCRDWRGWWHICLLTLSALLVMSYFWTLGEATRRGRNWVLDFQLPVRDAGKGEACSVDPSHFQAQDKSVSRLS